LRIQAKKLRYLAEFFASLHDKRATRRYLQSLSRLQDVLGVLNDVAVTQVIAKEAMARLTPSQRRIVQALIDGYVASSSAPLQERLDSSWKAFERADPFWRKRRK
jgi:CHAD domain-containing protein